MVNQVCRLEISQIDSPLIRRFHGYWRGKLAAPNVLPLRTGFDPADLRELLPNLVIIHVEREPLRFRYRLVGTRVVEFNALEFTGRYLGTMGWQGEHQLVEVCADATATGAPAFGFYSWTLTSGATGKCEFGVFPFSGDGRTVAQLFGIEDYDFPRDHAGSRQRP
ncbi:MAG TPA: PAS domain-containing protein [Dongiaceae bacterium]